MVWGIAITHFLSGPYLLMTGQGLAMARKHVVQSIIQRVSAPLPNLIVVLASALKCWPCENLSGWERGSG